MVHKKSLLAAMVCCLGFSTLPAQDKPLTGVIDIHVHSAPDSTPRSIDAIDLARLAKAQGMRGLVLKNHYEPTASLAYLVRKEVPGIEAFGGIDLNLSVGGMNPSAVEHMAAITGGYGRFVWMATFDSENQVRFSKQNRPFVGISRDGQLVSEAKAVIAVIAKHNLVMATGHSSAEECLLLLREAKAQGVLHMVVTHAMVDPVHMSEAQMVESAKLGAYVEFVYNGLIGNGKQYEFADYAKAIRAIGVDHSILSSDMGQVGNPIHTDGLVAFFKGLREQGFTQAEIRQMSRTNPARLLGLQ